jgi:hypothetical protein
MGGQRRKARVESAFIGGLCTFVFHRNPQVHRERPGSQGANLRNCVFDRFRRQHVRTERSESAKVGDRRGQPLRGQPGEWTLNDRIVDPEFGGETVPIPDGGLGGVNQAETSKMASGSTKTIPPVRVKHSSRIGKKHCKPRSSSAFVTLTPRAGGEGLTLATIVLVVCFLDYRTGFGAALGLMQRSAQLMGAFLPGHEMQEAQNKLEAFRLFAYVDRELRFPANLPSLQYMVRRAEALPPWRRIFALEGVAHYYTNGATADSPLIRLLADPGLPETAMVPMHSGMGTSLAGAALSRLGDQPSNADLRGALDGFFELCHANSRPGWHENSIEAMGLAVRTLHPNLLMHVSRVTGEIDSTAQHLFWHGVGRALYFVPMHFVTFGGSHERALHAAIDEAPTLEDRRNTVAGLVWAVTLVNIRHPAVLENLLGVCRAIRMPAAVTNGIVSAMMVWRHMIPESEEFLAPYLRTGSGPWNDLVVAPAVHAFAETLPGLTAPGQCSIATLFQYHDVEVRQI